MSVSEKVSLSDALSNVDVLDELTLPAIVLQTAQYVPTGRGVRGGGRAVTIARMRSEAAAIMLALALCVLLALCAPENAAGTIWRWCRYLETCR
ncbi:hypothetical protein MSG28_015856 [Choristoneura fumiferana]|uniref:Uncharacterized protein n=1 Tax=Choristoneura fumiferana TaxID=7141 RepID=A0ACC0K4W5_CHOFU|nr:hypothetical protein MSG28_015856 [Choristoneura fumiferana]